MPDPKPFHCRHIFTDRHQCGSPALRGEKLCFYHHAGRRPGKHQTVLGYTIVGLPDPDDLHAVQRGIAEVLRLAGTLRIDSQCASVLLRGLALASSNLARIDRQNAARQAAAHQNAAAGTAHAIPEIVQDYVEDPLLGTIALGPDPVPRPEGPIPDPAVLFTLEPRVTNIKSKAEEAANAALVIKMEQEGAVCAVAYKAARELRIAARKNLFSPIAIPKSVFYTGPEPLPVQSYPLRNEDFGPAGEIRPPGILVSGSISIPAHL